MAVVIRIVVGVLLVAHGLVHLLYLVDDVPEFTLDRSRLVPESARRGVGLALLTVTVAASVALGLAVWGVPVLSGAWPALAIATSVASLLLLALFWNTRLIFGVAIDVALIAVAVGRPPWTDSIG